jgi:murein DD-endopeptidase MepM/ murein hydrolase activator NlpD
MRTFVLLAAMLLSSAGAGLAAAGEGPSRATAAGSTSAARVAAGAPGPTVVAYSAPVRGGVQVVRPFRPPPTPYAAGHRGVDLRVAADDAVVAAADGVVRFAGPVAGRGVVVVAHADGISTEYEPVRPSVIAGQPVRRGQLLARLSGRHAGCAQRCLHWGARRGAQYLDPMTLLQPLGPAVLLPWPRDG